MKYIICSLLLCMGMTVAMAQEAEVYNSSGRDIGKEKKKKKQETGFDPSKLVFGGGLGLSIGDYTQISVSPIVGYRFSDEFSAGVGLGYQYVRVRDYYIFQNFSTLQDETYPYVSQMVTPSVWARYVIWNNIFVQGEMQYNIMKFKEYYRDGTTGYVNSDYATADVPCLLIGGGYRMKVTENSSVIMSVMYDVLQQEYSPYKNTVDVRFGFVVGF